MHLALDGEGLGNRRYSAVMHVELMRDPEREFPVVANPSEIRTLRVWHCKYRTLAPVGALRELEGLDVATVPDTTLELLTGLTKLRFLRIVHLPRVTSLRPLATLTSLESLSLQTLPSWDSSGKTTRIDGLEPLTLLPNLRHLELFGVVPEDRSPAALLACRKLRSARFSKFDASEVTRFYAAGPAINAYAPAAAF